MVKIKRSPSRKRYLRGKRIYDYFRLHFPVPSKFFERLKPYFKEDFQADITEDDAKVAFTYTYFKKDRKKNRSPQENYRTNNNPS